MIKLFRGRRRPSRASIKESCDNLPTGLCFAYANGLPILVNRRMYDLSLRLTGQDLQMADVFWNRLQTGVLAPGVERVSEPGAPRPEVCVGGKTYYLFTRTVICLEGESIFQITAADTTQLRRAADELARSNDELRRVGIRLRKYGEQVADLIREDEILAVKVRIHNEIGQTLTATRHLLGMEKAAGAGEVLAAWERITDMLRWEIEPKKVTFPLDDLRKAAGVLGMCLDIRGPMPGSGKDAELIVTVAAEMLTNAFRHAAAGILTIEVSRTGGEYRVCFTNDGAPPVREITEGGGIGSLRRRIEKLGGTLEVVSRPRFMLTIQFPMQEAMRV
ncbi:MAG: sensor histidine kinase [Butyricicoccaceae bacterium]